MGMKYRKEPVRATIVLNHTQALDKATRRLRYCALCSCVTNHDRGSCEYSDWHEQPRSD